MESNLHKSDDGWARLRERVALDPTRQRVRSARMDYRLHASKPRVPESEAQEPPVRPLPPSRRFQGRRRVTIDE